MAWRNNNSGLVETERMRDIRIERSSDDKKSAIAIVKSVAKLIYYGVFSNFNCIKRKKEGPQASASNQ